MNDCLSLSLPAVSCCRLPGSLLLAAFLAGCGTLEEAPTKIKQPEPKLLDSRGGIPAPRPVDQAGTVPPGGFTPAAPVTPLYPPDSGSVGEPGMQPVEVDIDPITPTPSPDMTTMGGQKPPRSDDNEIVLPPPVDSPGPLTHTVRKGESLWLIARMYGVTHQELAAHNGLDPNAVLPAEKVLNIPPGGRLRTPAEIGPTTPPANGGVSTPTPTPTPTPAAGGTPTPVPEPTPSAREAMPADGKYIVQSGDSLWKISRRFGVKSSDIRKMNGLDSDVLQIGQVLVLKEDAGTTPGGTAIYPTNTTPDSSGIEDVTGTDRTPADPGDLTPVDPNGPTDAADPGTDPDTATGSPVNDVPVEVLTVEHTVTKEEKTLQQIAGTYTISVEDLKKANPNITSDADLVEGTVLKVPLP